MRKIRIKDTMPIIRKARGMSMRELGRNCGMPSSSICRIETGENANPGIDTVVKIAEALNVPLSIFVFGPDKGAAHAQG